MILRPAFIIGFISVWLFIESLMVIYLIPWSNRKMIWTPEIETYLVYLVMNHDSSGLSLRDWSHLKSVFKNNFFNFILPLYIYLIISLIILLQVEFEHIKGKFRIMGISVIAVELQKPCSCLLSACMPVSLSLFPLALYIFFKI